MKWVFPLLLAFVPWTVADFGNTTELLKTLPSCSVSFAVQCLALLANNCSLLVMKMHLGNQDAVLPM